MFGVLNTVKTLVPVCEYRIAVELESPHPKRSESHKVKKVKDDFGLNSTQLGYRLRNGKDWRALFGDDMAGGLCFVPAAQHEQLAVRHASYTDAVKFGRVSIEYFRSMLQDAYGQALLAAGKALLATLDGPDCYFSWETEESPTPLAEMSAENRMAQLKPVKEALEDVSDGPDPTKEPHENAACQVCSRRTERGCYKNSATNVRIMRNEQTQALGLQWWGHCEVGETLGYLTGKVVPPGTGDRPRFVFPRGKYDLDCTDTHSKFRFLAHACEDHATVQLAQMWVSGRWRTAVQTVKATNNPETVWWIATVGSGPCIACGHLGVARAAENGYARFINQGLLRTTLTLESVT